MRPLMRTETAWLSQEGEKKNFLSTTYSILTIWRICERAPSAGECLYGKSKKLQTPPSALC